MTAAQLADVLSALRDAGCHNWNLVSPTPWLPFIEEAWKSACEKGNSLPVVYNTSGYETPDTLERYAHMTDIYLTDLRYADDQTAYAASGVRDYVSVARKALKTMWNLRGALRTDENEIAISGTICRLLILPGHAGEAVANLEWLASEIGTEIAVSVMAQYTPAYKAPELEGWNRGIAPDEYAQVVEAVESLGFEQGWIQDLDEPAPDSLIGHQMSAGCGIAV